MTDQKNRSTKWYRHLPNFLTLLNLVSGSFAIGLAISGEVRTAGILLLFAFLFDLFDGLAARLLKVQSAIGKELDSLADVVSFGVGPAAILYTLGLHAMGYASYRNFSSVMDWLIGLSPIVIPAFAALRLAQFNIDKRQSNRFIGVPTPASALLVVVVPLIISHQNDSWIVTLFEQVWYVPLFSLLMGLLMVAPLPLYSLKIKGFSWDDNRYTYIFLILALPLVIILRWIGVYGVVWMYLIYTGLLEKVLTKRDSTG